MSASKEIETGLNFAPKFDAHGLIPAIAQDAETGEVLMVAYMNDEALAETLKTGNAIYYSRSRKKLWTKGETSGNFLHVVSITADCDGDTLLVRVNPTGPVCHTGQETCFGDRMGSSPNFLFRLEEIINDRKRNPVEKSYTSHLFARGIKKISQKLGEEATEAVIEAVSGNKDRLKEEGADLLYHLLVTLSASEVSLSQIMEILEQRHGAARNPDD